MQHNCLGNNCATSGLRVVREERESTGRTVPTVVHKNPADLMLNTAQMRDAKYVRKLRVPPAEIEDTVRANEIRYAVEREVILQSAKSKAEARGEAGAKGKGKGKANPPSTGTSQSGQVTFVHQQLFNIHGNMYNTNK